MTEAELQKHLTAIKEPGDVNPQWKGQADATRAFARFLTVLAAEAAESSEKNLQMQREVIRATRVLLWFTAVLLIVAAVQTALMFFK